ncbi:hypothetical protein VNO77_05827 [Canavalia gladiata]|uniref:Amine oxidase n=1 Tax=Canavalia gladiata TaxID=3824 RepID=A0AAN9R912_CANGL
MLHTFERKHSQYMLRPISILTILVDLDLMKIVEYHDNTIMSAFTSEATIRSKSQGLGFNISGYSVSWTNWKFHIGFDARSTDWEFKANGVYHDHFYIYHLDFDIDIDGVENSFEKTNLKTANTESDAKIIVAELSVVNPNKKTWVGNDAGYLLIPISSNPSSLLF